MVYLKRIICWYLPKICIFSILFTVVIQSAEAGLDRQRYRNVFYYSLQNMGCVIIDCLEIES